MNQQDRFLAMLEMTVIQKLLKSHWCLGGHFDTGAFGFHQMFLLTFAVNAVQFSGRVRLTKFLA